MVKDRDYWIVAVNEDPKFSYDIQIDALTDPVIWIPVSLALMIACPLACLIVVLVVSFAFKTVR